MIIILVGDVILYCIYLCRIMESALYLTITAVINRFFLIIFGSESWIYGEMIVYLYYCFVLVIVIGRKRFPFED